MKKLIANLTSQNENHILPFLWVHGETPDIMRREIRRIYDCGIRALCVEARPHKDFNGSGWFEDLSVILEECKKLGMKMWLLDDSHFPTGFANGEVKKNHPALCKKYLCLKVWDYVGPIYGSGASLKFAMKSPDDKVLGVYLQRRTGFESIDIGETYDITPTLHSAADYNTGRPNVDWMGNILPGTQSPVPYVSFDLPEGHWSLNVLTVSYKGGEKETEGYLNPIVPEATDILLKTVYQPVYEYFADDFGETFQGFFSDEPRFGNIHGAEQASIGRNSAMNLPWRDDMPALLTLQCRKIGGLLAGMTEEKLLPLLPLLFLSGNEDDLAHALRFAYMDLVSRLYSENFDGRIAAWCHAHNCRHIGHCIEDNEAASRLGYGAGHLFRAMEHADMAGIDVVIHQLTPGQDRGLFKGMHSPGWDGEFFTYLLGKFGGSLAHLDAKKHGQCMCELFGAYGWAEGNRMGKWLADYMLVRGVNVLVPHAFDCASFPNSDCPPHFCADGKNPQYPEFRILMDYCNRLCEMFSGGIACPSVALYFNVEGEWSGDYMPTQKPAALLAQDFIDYDLISADYLEQALAVEGKLSINDMEMNALIFPYAAALPASLLSNVLYLADNGVPVFFADALPNRCTEGKDAGIQDALASHANIHVVPLKELPAAIRAAKLAELSLPETQPYLRYYHYRQSDGDLYFFVNESAYTRVKTVISGAKAGRTYVYNAFSNSVTENADAFSLDLPPNGSKLVLVPENPVNAPRPDTFVPCRVLPLTDCTLALAPMTELENGKAVAFCEEQVLERPMYVSNLPGHETFSGRIRYRFEIFLDNEWAMCRARVVLKGVREGAVVRVNGLDCGTCICDDYIFDASGLLAGKNIIEVELNTTLGRCMNDFLSSFLPMEPTGMSSAHLEFAEQ